MSELVEKVHGAVSNYCTHSEPPIQGRPCGMCDAITRAAIAAVAEWLAQSEDRECNPLQALAAALRAAGDGR